MIHFKPAENAEQVTAIMTEPHVWQANKDDYSLETANFKLPYGIYILAYDDEELLGVYQLEAQTNICMKVHASYLPIAWGTRSKIASRKFYEWLFDNTQAQIILGFIPSHNVKMLAHAKKIGMIEEGRIKSIGIRDGQYFDHVIMKLTKMNRG